MFGSVDGRGQAPLTLALAFHFVKRRSADGDRAYGLQLVVLRSFRTSATRSSTLARVSLRVLSDKTPSSVLYTEDPLSAPTHLLETPSPCASVYGAAIMNRVGGH
jgi:hypothetical protein